MILFRLVYPPKQSQPSPDQLDYALERAEYYKRRILMACLDGYERQGVMVGYCYWQSQLRQLTKRIPLN